MATTDIDWQKIQDQLYTWFKTGTGLSEVRFENDAEPDHAEAFGELSFIGLPFTGRDWVETVRDKVVPEDPDDDKLFYRVHGKRYLVVKVACISYSQLRSKFALQYLFKLQSRVFLPRMLEILKVVDLVPGNDAFTDIVVPDVEIDERFFSKAEFNVRFQLAYALDDTGVENELDWFDKVEVSTVTQDEAETPLLENVSGEPLPDSLQVNEEIIGPPPTQEE